MIKYVFSAFFVLYFCFGSFVYSQNTDNEDLKRRNEVEKSLVLLKNDNRIVPVDGLETNTVLSVEWGRSSLSEFTQGLRRYDKMDAFVLTKNFSDTDLKQLKKLIRKHNTVIVSLHGLNPDEASFGMNEALFDLFDYINKKSNMILVIFDYPKAYGYMHGLSGLDALIVAQTQDELVYDYASQLIFGGIAAQGVLQESICECYPEGDGLITERVRFKYTIPAELSLDADFINAKIDSIVDTAISAGAFPGCVVFAAKDEKVFFRKAYGYHTYDKKNKVRITDLYDLASVTKINGGLPCIMHLYDLGKINLDVPFSTYWPDFKGTDKENLTFREILAHQSGLKSWIPYWKNTIDENGNFKPRTFKHKKSWFYPTQVTDSLYLWRWYKKQIYRAIKESKLSSEKKYVYSGLVFYLIPKIVENMTGKDFEDCLYDYFYHPLGAYTLCYNPMRWYPKDRIVPTERDTFFRMTQIHGRVHDEGAAMMGGISGNAGLFAKADDLAKMMQMYLNKGEYAGRRYIKESTVDEFIRRQYPENNNRRGLGFDKPVLKNRQNGSCAPDASDNSFGHSGYTGTFVWADPDNGLLFVFLTNRVYPTRNNKKIYRLNVRPSIHQVFYDAIKMSNKK